MNFKYLAINGDNVGDSIGSAIASDNHEELSKLTGGLKDAHGAIEEWVQSVGGEIVTSSGDEGIYKVPADSFDEATIENLKNQYSESAGTTLTIGMGDSMSEASKALIYGKMNDKDQIVEYDPHIDDYIASQDGGMEEEYAENEEMGEEAPEEEYSEEMPGEEEFAGEEMPEGAVDNGAVGEFGEETSEELPDSEIGDSNDDIEYQEEIPEGEEMPMEGETVGEETDEAIPGQEYGEEDESLFEEGELGESDLDVNPEDKLDDVVGTDIDGDGDIDAMPMEDEGEMAPEGMEGEEEMMPGEEGEEIPMEGEEGESALTDMIHANMGEEESPEGEEGDTEELRQDIAASLMTFKENKPMLEQAKTENPKLYEATILMLRSMIEMAKKLNMNPEQDVMGQESMDDLPGAEEAQMEDGEEFEEAAPEEDGLPPETPDEIPEEEDELPPEAEKEEEDEDKEKKPFGKSEIVKLYGDLIKGCETLSKGDKKKVKKKPKTWRERNTSYAKRKKAPLHEKRADGRKPLDVAMEDVQRKMGVDKKVSTKKK
jgi:hypothetical protein